MQRRVSFPRARIANSPSRAATTPNAKYSGTSQGATPNSPSQTSAYPNRPAWASTISTTGPMTAASAPHTRAGVSPNAHQISTANALIRAVVGTAGPVWTSAVTR